MRIVSANHSSPGDGGSEGVRVPLPAVALPRAGPGLQLRHRVGRHLVPVQVQHLDQSEGSIVSHVLTNHSLPRTPPRPAR